MVESHGPTTRHDTGATADRCDWLLVRGELRAANRIGLTLIIERVEGAKIRAGSEIKERRLRRQDDRRPGRGKHG